MKVSYRQSPLGRAPDQSPTGFGQICSRAKHLNTQAPFSKPAEGKPSQKKEDNEKNRRHRRGKRFPLEQQAPEN
jgi:hypothetical protein